jgi:hypothetical protein
MNEITKRFEQLVSDKLAQIETEVRESYAAHDTAAKQFSSLRSSLEEVISCINPNYYEASISESSASIRIGVKRNGELDPDATYGKPDIEWEIELHSEDKEIDYDEFNVTGCPSDKFIIEETIYHSTSAMGTSESVLTFRDEDLTMKYLMSKIAKLVAGYKWQEEGVAAKVLNELNNIDDSNKSE